MRLAATWLGALLDDAFASRAPSPPRHLLRALARFSAQRGLVVGAPIVRDDEALRPETGGLAPLIRFVVTLVDAARLVAAAEGAGDARARALVTATLATLLDDEETARRALATTGGRRGDDEALVIRVGKALRTRRLLFGNPIVGLTLVYALTAVDATLALELLVRLAHGVSPEDTRPLRLRAARERVFVVAEIAALTGGRPGLEIAMDVASWQVKKLGLPRREAATLVDALAPSFDVDEHADRLDRSARRRALHALHLVVRLDGVVTDDERRFLAQRAALYGISPVESRRVGRRVATFMRAHRALLNPLEKAVGFEIDGAPISVKVARALRVSSQSVITEMRETGDLAVLLAKRAAGQPLSDEETRRMWEQLKDLARVVPSLAIFTLPGGALLLPILFRILPFELRPSAFRPGRFRAFDGADGSIPEGGPVDDAGPGGER